MGQTRFLPVCALAGCAGDFATRNRGATAPAVAARIADMRAHDLVTQVAREHAPRREHRREPRHHHARQIERARDGGHVNARGASEGQQGETARVDPATDRYQPDPLRHAGVDDAVDALRRGHAADAEPRGNGVHRPGGGLHIEPLPAAEETCRVEEAEHEVGVGHGRCGPAPPVAGRSRIGAGTGRADVQHTAGVDAGDGAATRADARDVEAVQGDPVTGDPAVGGDRGLALHDERHVGARAAHVEGDEVAVPEDPARVPCRRHPAGRSRKDSAGGEPDRIGHCRESAVRLHDEHRPSVPPPRPDVRQDARDSAPAPGRRRR